MTDDDLIAFLGLTGYPVDQVARLLASLTPDKRVVYEKMARVCTELELWVDGRGPKPTGVIICHDHNNPEEETSHAEAP